MNKLRFVLMAFVVGALAWLPMGGTTARADDDWEDRWEDYYEELEERREEAREAAEERWEDEQERVEELYEDGVIVRPRRGWRVRYRHYYRPRPIVREWRYYREPVYGPVYPEGVPVYAAPPPYEYRYRYYGVPGAGYVEGPYGERSVQVGPVRVYWHR